MAQRKINKAAYALSLLVHLIAISAMAAWSAEEVFSRVRFAGRARAMQLTVVMSEPVWVPEPISLEVAAEPEAVVIQPRIARIAKQRSVHTPITDVLNAELTAMLEHVAPPDPATRPSSPPRQAAEPTDVPSPRPQPRRHEVTPRLPSPTSVAQPPSQAGTSRKTPPDFSRNAPPTYPTLAIQRRWEGTVLLRVVVGADGAIKSVEVARSSGHSLLDGQAVTEVRQWKGRPAMRGGKPVETVELLPVQFKL